MDLQMAQVRQVPWSWKYSTQQAERCPYDQAERRMPIHPLLLYRCRSISSQSDFTQLDSDGNAPAAAAATHRVDCEGCGWLACRAACLALHDIPPRLPHSLIFRLRLNDEKMRFQPIMSPAGIQSLSRFEVSKVRYRSKYKVSSSEATETSPTVTVHVSPFNAANSPPD